MNNLEYIGSQIRKYRKRENMTQKELAQRIGKTESSIRKYEKGLVDIPNVVLEKIANVLCTSVVSLLDSNSCINMADRALDDGYPEVSDELEKAARCKMLSTVNSEQYISLRLSELNPDGVSKVKSYLDDILKISEYTSQ